MKRRPMCLVCLGLALGIWLMRLSGLPVFGEPKNSRLEALAQSEETVRVRGQVQDYEIKTNSKSYLITSCVLHVQENEIPVKKLYLITQQEELLTIGSKIETEGILEKPETPANPGQFDTASWYAAKGVFYTMWADEIRTVEKAGTGAAEGLKRLRSRIAGNLSAMLPKSQAGILSAMLIGDKSLLDSEVKAAYQTGGVLHVLSISGLHLSMLGMGLFRLLQKTGCHRTVSSVLSIAGMVVYTVFTGSGVATRRAFLMFAVMVTGGLIGRTYDSMSALALAAVITLLGQPENLSYSGFLLSYIAVIGAALVWPVWKKSLNAGGSVEKSDRTAAGKGNGILLNKIKGWEGKQKKKSKKNTADKTREREQEQSMIKKQALHMGEGLKENIMSCFVITLTTLPLTAYFFYEIPLLSLLPNLVILPTMAWVMGFGILGCCLGLISVPLGRLALFPASVLLRVYEAVMELVGNIPGAVWICGQPSLAQVTVFYLIFSAVLWGISWASREENAEKSLAKVWRTWRGKLLCGAVLAVAVVCLLFRKDPPLSVTTLDVGQGDSLVVRSGGGTAWLIDGGSTDEKNVGTYRILPYLKNQGIGTLDGIFVTHSDADHVNGVRELLELSAEGRTALNICRLFLPLWMKDGDCARELEQLAGKAGTAVSYLKKGDRVTAGELSMEVLHPDGEDYQSEPNAGSLVLSLSYREFDALLTGDVQGEGEEKLQKLLQESPQDYEYLKAAHHGSKNSTPEEFLSIVRPRAAVISCSASSRYGHPHQELLERLEAAAADIYVTADTGALTCVTDGYAYTIRGFRATKVRMP